MAEQDDKQKTDKKNTDLWKQKQEEKKKKKEQGAQKKEEDGAKADKKEKKKKDKKEGSGPQQANSVKTESKTSDGVNPINQKVIIEHEKVQPTYRNITKVNNLLTPKER